MCPIYKACNTYILLYTWQLQHLDADEFKDLKYLKHIHLDSNQLSTIVSGLFSSQKSLEYLGKFYFSIE